MTSRALRPAAWRGLVICLISCALACAALPSTGRADAGYLTAVNSLQTTIANSLNSYMGLTSSTGPRTYSAGAFSASDGPDCWNCYDAAAVGAAVLSQTVPADTSMKSLAVTTFDTAIADHQLADGAFDDSTGAPDGITTGFFTVDLGMAYLELRSSLPASTQTLWSNSIAAAARYLISSGNTNWYANGNIVLRQTEVLWLAYAATGDPSFRSAYDAEYAFALAPSQSRWPGFGLQITRAPTKSNGADGAGYLAESGGGAPGFDPNYTMAQLDTATDLYVLTRDPKYLRLMNLLYNQLSPLVSSSWVLNATGGTRQNYFEPFMTGAVSVLAASGARPDITPAMVQNQITVVEDQYQGAESFTNVNFYKGFESWLSLPLLNLQWPAGMAPDTRVTSTSSTSSSTSTTTSPQPITVTVTPSPVAAAGSPTVAIGVTVNHAPPGASTTVAVVATPPHRTATTVKATTARKRVSRHARRARTLTRVTRVTHSTAALKVTLHVRRRALRAHRREGRLVVEVTVRSGGHRRVVRRALSTRA